MLKAKVIFMLINEFVELNRHLKKHYLMGGVLFLWILCIFSNNISKPSCLRQLLSALAEMGKSFCFMFELKVGVSQSPAQRNATFILHGNFFD